MVNLPVPISAGIILSYKCSAKCRHCLYACSPQWKADWLPGDQIEQLLSLLADKIQPAPWGENSIGVNHGLHFSGGEPFLNFELLLQAVNTAARLKIPSTFVETNCAWCVDDKSTTEKLTALKTAGLKGIMISVNPYYAEYVPFSQTERCIQLSLEIFQQNVIVYQYEYYRLLKQLNIKDCITVENYQQLVPHSPLQRQVELFLMGRATKTLRKFYPAYPAGAFLDMNCVMPFFREWHNHFDNYGLVVPGFCAGLSLGNWMDLPDLIQTGIDVDNQPILAFLINEDVAGLFHFARERGYPSRTDGYISRCDLCLDIRRFLVKTGDFSELKPLEFYAILDSEGQ